MRTNFTLRTAFIFVLSLGLTLKVYSQAANNTCAAAVTLTPATTCSTTAPASSTTGNLQKATSATTDGSISGSCGGATAATTFDVWFKFVANTAYPGITITLPNSTNLTTTSTYIELLSGASCASLTSVKCQDISSRLIPNSALTIGNTYYVRVYTTVQGTSNPIGKWDFDICIQTPPANDDCSGAVTLTPATTCSTTSTTLELATASTGLPAGCESVGTHYDVWYKFVAGQTYELISLSSLGTSLTNPEMQLYSGTCGSLTSLQCGTTSITATGLTVGTTYYVRVSNVGSVVSSNGSFNICVYHPTSSTYDFGKSYVNISKNSGGGTINPGDTLEIRATLVIRNAGSALDSLAFFDTLHTGGGIKLIPGTIALRTNEGKIYRRDNPVKSAFTDAFDTDMGYTYQNGTDTIVRINFGVGSSGFKRGRLANTDRPSVFGTTCIIMATYRVVVYAGYNTTINLGGGAITMIDANTGISNNLSFSSRNAIVYSSPGLCPNAVAASNAIGGDNNGTFGSGTAQNRSSSSNVLGYTYATFTTGAPQDYYYGVANNTSAGGTSFTTTTTWTKPDNSSPTHRVFNLWDITGDHTGAANPTKGNPPCDPTKPISSSNPCGYMLIVNSAYKTDTAFQYTVTNLCPNSYYEISAWLKNICYKCGCDSMGVGSSTAGYIPSALNDSSGVQPNLTFDINGTDYYTTGNVPYGGLFPSTQTGSDSNNTWIKRGFTYLTGASQTSFTLTIRNNAPGGGGNDWAMDDISLATCLPNMQYSPSLNPTTCNNNAYDVKDTIRSYFSNYINYKWQRSTDGGSTWSDISGATGTGSPVWNGSAYEYITSYTIPNTATYVANNGDKYRVIVATTSGNLGNTNCQVTDGVSQISLNVLDCNNPPPLNTYILSFNANETNNHANLYWSTNRENEQIQFEIERSKDGINFSRIGSITGTKSTNEINHYSFVDSSLSAKTYYRISLITSDGRKKYSRIIQLKSNADEFSVSNLTTYFESAISFDVNVNKDCKIDWVLLNSSGNTVRLQSITAYNGANNFVIPNLNSLAPGIYILQVRNKENTVTLKAIKK
jgi:hypothetical protein